MEKSGGIMSPSSSVFGNALKEDIPTSQTVHDMARRRISEARQLRDA